MTSKLSDRALKVAKIREEEGIDFQEIANRLGIHRSTASRDWERVLRSRGINPKDFRRDEALKSIRDKQRREREEQEINFKVEDSIEADQDKFAGLKMAPGVKARTEGMNEITLEISQDDVIHTIPQLLEACEVDLDVWIVKDPEISTWPGWRKDKKVDVTWTDGRADGYVKDTGGITVRQLFRVFCRLIRKEPIAVTPVIVPVESTITFENPKPQYIPGEVYRSLILADLQVGFRMTGKGSQLEPFHDRRVLDLVLQVAELGQPDRVDILGDCLDLPNWSLRWLKEPEFVWTTQPSIFELHYWLKMLRSILPNAEINYYEGNHEKRLPDTIMSVLPAAYQLTPADIDIPVMTIPFLLGFEGLGINFIGGYPNNVSYLGTGVTLIHGTIARKNPGATAAAVAQGAVRTVVYGHGHSLEYLGWVHDGAWDGEFLVDVFCPGCGCRVDYKVPGHVRGQIWRQGLGEIDYTLDGTHHIKPLPIREGVMMYEGQILKARPETTMEGLYEAFPGWAWTSQGMEFWE